MRPVEAELDRLAFVGFAAFGVAEAEHLGHEGIRCAVVGVALLGAQVAEGNGGRLSADCGVGIEGQVLPVSGAGGQLAFEGELIAVEDESSGLRRKFGASGDGEEHAMASPSSHDPEKVVPLTSILARLSLLTTVSAWIFTSASLPVVAGALVSSLLQPANNAAAIDSALKTFFMARRIIRYSDSS